MPGTKGMRATSWPSWIEQTSQRDRAPISASPRRSGLGAASRSHRQPPSSPGNTTSRLPRLRREWPNLKLYLREEPSQAACEALQRGQLDCVLLALPFSCGEVDSALLFDDPLFVAFPRGEAPYGSGVEVDAIDENRMLLLEDGHCLKDHALSACNRPDLRAHAAMMGTSLHTLVQMVDNGLGLTFIEQELTKRRIAVS